MDIRRTAVYRKYTKMLKRGQEEVGRYMPGDKVAIRTTSGKPEWYNNDLGIVSKILTYEEAERRALESEWRDMEEEWSATYEPHQSFYLVRVGVATSDRRPGDEVIVSEDEVVGKVTDEQWRSLEESLKTLKGSYRSLTKKKARQLKRAAVELDFVKAAKDIVVNLMDSYENKEWLSELIDEYIREKVGEVGEEETRRLFDEIEKAVNGLFK